MSKIGKICTATVVWLQNGIPPENSDLKTMLQGFESRPGKLYRGLEEKLKTYDFKLKPFSRENDGPLHYIKLGATSYPIRTSAQWKLYYDITAAQTAVQKKESMFDITSDINFFFDRSPNRIKIKMCSLLDPCDEDITPASSYPLKYAMSKMEQNVLNASLDNLHAIKWPDEYTMKEELYRNSIHVIECDYAVSKYFLSPYISDAMIKDPELSILLKDVADIDLKKKRKNIHKACMIVNNIKSILVNYDLGINDCVDGVSDGPPEKIVESITDTLMYNT